MISGLWELPITYSRWGLEDMSCWIILSLGNNYFQINSQVLLWLRDCIYSGGKMHDMLNQRLTPHDLSAQIQASWLKGPPQIVLTSFWFIFSYLPL